MFGVNGEKGPQELELELASASNENVCFVPLFTKTSSFWFQFFSLLFSQKPSLRKTDFKREKREKADGEKIN